MNLGDYTAIPERLAEAISPKTKAIVMAHTLGMPFNLDVVMDLVNQHHLWLVEDELRCPRIEISRPFDRNLRPPFDIFLLSGPSYHHGGRRCVGTEDDELARIARPFRDWGRDCYCAGGENNTCGKRYGQQFGELPAGYDHKYVYSHIGYNLKITDMQAAVGCAQLEKLDEFTSLRRRISGS